MIIAGKFDCLAVTPSDTQDIVAPSVGTVAQTNANPNFLGAGQTGNPSKERNLAWGIACAVGGTVTFIDNMANTQQVTLVAGFTYYFRITRVKATGTAATGIMVFIPVYQ